MFTGQPFKNWNIYMYDIVMPIFYGGQKEGVKGVVKALNETKRAALFAVALPAMAMSFIAKKRLPKTWREFFIDLLAYPMSAFPILGASMSRRLQGWDQATFETLYQSVSKGIEEVLADVVSGKMDITDGSDLWKSTKEIQKLALLVYGQPQFPVKVMNKVFEDLVQRGVAEDIPEAMDFIKRVTNLEPAPPPSKQ